MNESKIKLETYDLLFYQDEMLSKVNTYIQSIEQRKLNDELRKQTLFKKEKDLDDYNKKLDELRTFVNNDLSSHFTVDIIKNIISIIDRLERILWNDE